MGKQLVITGADFSGIAIETPKTLSSIAITTQPTKRAYNINEYFNPAGMVVTATYSDSSTAVVTGYTYSPYQLTTTGTQTITVTCTRNGNTKTTTTTVTVS